MFGQKAKTSPLIAPAFHKELADHPVTLVDVGARGGIQEKWRPLEHSLSVVAFEPDAEEHARLAATAGPGERYFQTALGSRKEVRSLNLTRSPGCSSFLTPNMALLSLFEDAQRFEVERRVDIDVIDLDSLIAGDGGIDADFMKLDAQGFEMEILAGAERTLTQQLVGLEIEVGFQSVYENQPLFPEIDVAMRAKGFQLYDLRPYYWKRVEGMNFVQLQGEMVFADALYLRRPETDMTGVFGTRARIKLLHMAAIYLVYGYLDAALAVLNRNRDLLTPQETTELDVLPAAFERAVRQDKRWWRSYRLHELLVRLADRTDHNRNNAWAMRRTLGNKE